MSQTAADAAREAAGQLGALARELAERGFTARVMNAGGNECLAVVNRSVPELRENVYAIPDNDGTWWFRWSWGDPIALIGDVAMAAFKIAYVLTPSADD